jgi:hypothetical protein
MATTKQKKTVTKATKKPDKFKTLTKAQKRVAIAKDVIKQLNAARFNARNGYYLIPNPVGTYSSFGTSILENIKAGTELQNILKKNIERCDCCAKGALFMSAVEKYNQCKVTKNMKENDGRMFDDSDITKHLRGIFSQDQLTLIESAFEGFYLDGEIANNPYDSPTYRFKRNFTQPDDCMRAIMENIIENKGTFVIPIPEPDIISMQNA